MATTKDYNGVSGTGAAYGGPEVTTSTYGTEPVAANTPTSSSESPEHIRRTIDRTRGEMDRTIDEIGERLHPRHLLDDVVDAVKGQFTSRGGSSEGDGLTDTAGRFGRSLADSIRENPMPAALIGAGLAWMFFEDRNSGGSRPRRGEYGRYNDLPEHSGSYVDARTGKPYDDSYGSGYSRDRSADSGPGMANRVRSAASGAQGAASSAGSAVGNAAHSVAETARDAVGAVGEFAGDAADAVRGYAGSAADYIGSTADGVSHGVSDATGSARSYGRSAARSARGYGRTFTDQVGDVVAGGQDRARDAMEDKPLAVAAAAAAAGLLVGLLLPHTRYEDELCGTESDRLKDDAWRQGREALEQGKEAAGEVVGSVTDEAKRKGLTPSTLADKAMAVAGDALTAAKKSARDEGLDPKSLKEKVKDVGQVAKQEVTAESQKVKAEVVGTSQPGEVQATRTT